MPVKPKLGQNFLVDSEAIQRIAASIGDLTGRTVVEIGPGRGAITAALAARAAHVLAVELDRELAAGLRVQFLDSDRVTVVEQDVLQFDFAAASAAAGERLLVVGNLPYGITSPILLKLAASHAALDRAVLMVQREVADRVVAQPGSRDYGLLSVTVQIYGPGAAALHAAAESFRRRPRCIPPSSAGALLRASPSWAWKRPASCASSANASHRSGRRWPTICAPPESRLRLLRLH